MASFEAAIPTILFHEGGYSNNPADPGGPTNFGVSLRYLQKEGTLGDFNHDGLIDARDIQAMSKENAAQVYRDQWWNAYGYGDIQDQSVATKVLDMSVNMGPPEAHKLLQRAIGCCGVGNLAVDGQLGPQTMACLNHCDAQCLLFHLRDQCSQFYRSLVVSKPKLEPFLKGWLRRAYA